MKRYSRIAITGSKGILGSSFVRKLTGVNDLLPIRKPEIDITDRGKIRQALTDFSADLVIHCASYTAVDQAEIDKEKAFKVNALATRYIAEAWM